MFFGKIKKYSLYIVFSFFLTSNAFLVGQAFPFKKTLVILLLIVTVVSSFFQKEELKKVIYYFIYFNNDKTIKKISGGLSLLAWVSFTSSLFFLNVDSLWLARGFFLFFIASVIVSGIFIFYDLERGGHVIFNKLKFLFFSGIPVLYFVTSAYAASYFLQFSNMDISDSPLLELGWKSAFFAICLFVVLQPISYWVFLYVSNKFKDHKVMTSLGLLLFTSLLSLAILRWADNIMVLALDWATRSEWHTFASCGTLNFSVPSERYFGFNSDKYTVYFSNRSGKWGFDEIKCVKDDNDQDSFKRIPVSQSEMPKWFNE